MTSGLNDENELNILAIDTTSKNCSICISRKDLILVNYNFISNNDLSSNIITIIDFLLKQVNLDISDIDAYGIGTGPGIFTGIRVGMATVKGLAFDSGKKVVPVNILEAMASRNMGLSIKIVPVIDAKREQVYTAGYDIDKENITEFMLPSLIDVSKMEAIFSREKKYNFIGSGAVIYKNILKNSFPDSTIINEVDFLASDIAKITYDKIISGKSETDIENINPLYIRKTDAEENYERNHKKGKDI